MGTKSVESWMSSGNHSTRQCFYRELVQLKKERKKTGGERGSAATFEHKFCWSLNMGE